MFLRAISGAAVKECLIYSTEIVATFHGTSFQSHSSQKMGLKRLPQNVCGIINEIILKLLNY